MARAEVAVAWSPLGNAAVELRSLTATEPARRREQLERRLTSSSASSNCATCSRATASTSAPRSGDRHARLLPELGQRDSRALAIAEQLGVRRPAGLASAAERRTPLLLGIPSGDRQSVRYRMPAGLAAGDVARPGASQQTPFGTSRCSGAAKATRSSCSAPSSSPGHASNRATTPTFRDFIAAVKAADAQLVLLQKETGR
jgi:hypothetical protein